MRDLKTSEIASILGLTASTFILVVKIIQPTYLQITVEGKIIETQQIPPVYTTADIILTSVAGITLGLSLYHLLSPKPAARTADPDHWQATLSGLTDPDETALYRILVDAQGSLFQSELVEKSGFPKSKVSLILDRLEARQMIERRRHGMSNMVLLK